MITDQAGFILTHPEWYDLMNSIRKFYAGATPEQIGEANVARENSIHQHTENDAPKEDIVPARRPGYVYVLRSDNGKFKIGKTGDPKNRFKTLGIQLPYKLETVMCLSVDDMDDTESFLHLKYANQRLNGEWFELSNSDIEEIRACLS